MNCREDETNQRKTHGPGHIIVTEFWTATDFLTVDYNIKICEQQMCFHRYRTTDYLYFFFFSNRILLLLLLLVVVVVVFSNLILFRNIRTEIRIYLQLKKNLLIVKDSR